MEPVVKPPYPIRLHGFTFLLLLIAINLTANERLIPDDGSDAGAAYVYRKTADGWRYFSKILAKYRMPGDRFGWNVALSGDRAIIAAPHHDVNGQDSGAAFVQDLRVYNEFHSRK